MDVIKMDRELIYDFHTHINDLSLFEKYHEYDIVPVVNCQNIEEFEAFEKKVSDLNERAKHLDYKFYFSIGIHPNDSFKYKDYVDYVYREMADKTLLIGEIGMDARWCDVDFQIQEDVFVKSLKKAEEYNKTVILHTKDMEKRIYDIIKDYDLNFVIHWYSCEKFIKEYIDLGCYFTIGPAIMNDKNVVELVRNVPLDRLLIETDGIEALEWLFNKKIFPDNLRGILETVIREISEIKGISEEEVKRAIKENSERLLL